RRSLCGDQESAGLEPHLPVMVAGAIACLKRRIGVARRKAQPALLRFPQHDGAGVLEQKHRAVNELIAALKGNGDIGALVGLAAKTPTRTVLLANHQRLAAIVVLEIMQPAGKPRVAGRAHYPGDGNHASDLRTDSNATTLRSVSLFGGGQV